ncbi:MAG TPA: CAP domain-containing protein [Hyphomicrobiaceae bacterium]|nr:CAP domain-containing protein [Hyphomicrobiaceae bacterium]
MNMRTRAAALGAALCLSLLVSYLPQSRAQGGVSSRNATVVAYATGQFRQTGPKAWVEVGNGGGTFNFTETGRNDTSVYLSDASRGIRIELNVSSRQIFLAHGGGPKGLLYRVTSVTADPVGPGTPPPPPIVGGGNDVAAVLALVNRHRSDGAVCGGQMMRPVPPLKLNAALTTAAAEWSLAMQRAGKLSHDRMGERLAAACGGAREGGENVAAGSPTPALVLQNWMQSPGHCRNIMSPSMTDIGIGRAGNFWTQLFAKDC